MWVQSLGRGDPLRGGDGNLLQYSCLKTLNGGARSQSQTRMSYQAQAFIYLAAFGPSCGT